MTQLDDRGCTLICVLVGPLQAIARLQLDAEALLDAAEPSLPLVTDC